MNMPTMTAPFFGGWWGMAPIRRCGKKAPSNGGPIWAQALKSRCMRMPSAHFAEDADCARPDQTRERRHGRSHAHDILPNTHPAPGRIHRTGLYQIRDELCAEEIRRLGAGPPTTLNQARIRSWGLFQIQATWNFSRLHCCGYRNAKWPRLDCERVYMARSLNTSHISIRRIDLGGIGRGSTLAL